LYVSPSWDINPLQSINGKASIYSLDAFLKKYPNGKVPRNSKEYGKAFVCRRGCNTRTASYTEEFVWEEIFHGTQEDVFNLIEHVKKATKATRRRRAPKEESPDPEYNVKQANEEDEDYKRTPRKAGSQHLSTPRKRKPGSNAVTPSSHRKYGLEMRIICIAQC
jgi:origin recognition complex subunit 1